MSKFEQGTQRPTDEDLDQWARAVGATDEQRSELHILAAAARVEYATFRQRYRDQGGAIAEQESTALEDAASTRIAQFQPMMIPGLLQTAAYAREVLNMRCGPKAEGAAQEDIDQLVGKRIERQHILYDGTQTIDVIIGEAALHTRFGGAETLAGQLDRLVTLIGLPRVSLGIVPFDGIMPVFPLSMFIVYDDHVLIELLNAQTRLDSAEQVAAYETYFSQLREAAVFGADAVALIQRAAKQLRE